MNLLASNVSFLDYCIKDCVEEYNTTALDFQFKSELISQGDRNTSRS